MRLFVVLAHLVGLLLLASNVESNANIRILQMNSLTRLEGTDEDLRRIVDIPHTLEMLIVESLIQELNKGSLPIPRSEAYECEVNFTSTVMDTVSDFAEALEQLDRSVIESHDIIVGPTRSSTCIPVSFVVSTEELVVFSPTCTSPELDDFEAHRFFARTVPSDDAAARAIVDLLLKITDGRSENDGVTNYTQAVVLYQEDTYGSNFKDSLFVLGNNKIEFTLIPFIPGNSLSLVRALDAAKETNLNVFIGIMFDEFFAEFSSIAIDNELMGEGKFWVFTDGISGAQDIVTAIETAEDGLFQGLTNRQVFEFIENIFLIQAKGQVDGNGDEFMENVFVDGQGYDLEYLKDLLAQLGQAEIPGISLSADFSEVIDIIEGVEPSQFLIDSSFFAYDVVVAIREFLDTKLEDVCRESILGADFMDTIKAESFFFDGVSGQVRFDGAGSRTAESSAFKLLNARFRYEEDAVVPADVEVGEYSDPSTSEKLASPVWQLNTKLRFPGNSLTAPRLTDLPEVVERNEIGNGIKATIVTISITMLFLVGALVVFIYKNLHKPIVAAAQPEFLLLALVGVVIVVSGVLVYPQEPLDLPTEEAEATADVFGCNISFYLFSIGNTISYGALIIKLQRLLKVSKINPDVRDGVEDSMTGPLLSLGLILLVNILIITIVYNTDPLRLDRNEVETDEFGQPINTVDRCVPDNGVVYLLFFFFICGLYGFGIRLIIRVRDLPKDFQEGRWISYSIASQLQLFLLAIPMVLAVGEEDPGVRYLVISMLALLSNAVLLLLIFGPKVRRVLVGREDVEWKNNLRPNSGFISRNDPNYSSKANAVRQSLFNTMDTAEFAIGESAGNEYEHSL